MKTPYISTCDLQLCMWAVPNRPLRLIDIGAICCLLSSFSIDDDVEMELAELVGSVLKLEEEATALIE